MHVLIRRMNGDDVDIVCAVHSTLFHDVIAFIFLYTDLHRRLINE